MRGRSSPGQPVSTGTPGLVVRDLCKSFGGRVVLDDIGFEVLPGEVVALLGPNGAGKTTLLRCVVGSEHADSGEVTLNGQILDERHAWARRAVCAVLDDLDFFGDMTAVEHLDLFARAHGTPGPQQQAHDALRMLGLSGVKDQFPGTLSSGQRRRLALATTCVRPMALLVLDEPEQRLDGAGRAWLRRHLTAVAEGGAAVLLASHDDELVHDIRARVLRLHEP